MILPFLAVILTGNQIIEIPRADAPFITVQTIVKLGTFTPRSRLLMNGRFDRHRSASSSCVMLRAVLSSWRRCPKITPSGAVFVKTCFSS